MAGFNLPTGSEESVIMTSKLSTLSSRKAKPSPMWILTLGCSNPAAMLGKNFLEARMTACGTTISNTSRESYILDQFRFRGTLIQSFCFYSRDSLHRAIIQLQHPGRA